ncbi:MAG: hypothetical protein M1812_000472 [Candelaria pacifica]|nr:MAG: hypothetical protein M1812_000472 [Candelaria pacifica]
MPQWGRPPGARKGKKRREWDEQARQWEEARRFEELQTDDDDGQGVSLGAGLQQKRFVSDELKFTGVDMGPRPSHRRRYDFSDDSEYSDGDDDNEDEDEDEDESVESQLNLRDKEEDLVETAMDRIRRAQLKGKLDVKLTKAEMDALERKTRQRGQTRPSRLRAESKASRSSGGSGSDKRAKVSRKSSTRQLAGERAGHRADRHPSRQGDVSPPQASGYPPPGFIVAGPGGMPTYAPLGYFGPSAVGPSTSASRSGSRAGSRSASAHNQQQYAHPLPQYQHPYQQGRYFSVPEGSQPPIRPSSSSSRRSAGTPPNSRALPDDPDWLPRSRASSSAQMHASPDPFQYMTYSPPLPQMPEQYLQPRRNVSGPTDSQQPTRRSERLRQSAKLPASASDPSLSRRRSSPASSSEQSSSDGGNGVQVVVEESPSPPSRKRSDSKGSVRSRTGSGWQRRGRR